MQRFLYANAVGISVVAFASYLDVYSHRHLYFGVDPWWNPAHLLLYSGFLVMVYGIVSDVPRGKVRTLSIVGTMTVIAAAAFNEFWHRVLLFGNPLPEPFPIEPPHALLAVGLILLGVAALAYPVFEGVPLSDFKSGLAISMIGGSLWLIVGGSALYVAGAYGSTPAVLFAVGVSSFSASLFVAYPTAMTGKFGFTTLSYLWFLLVYYLFFLNLGDGLPLGIALVLVLDFALARGKVLGFSSRWLLFPTVAILYGVIYYPILPIGLTLALNAGLLASMVGVGIEFLSERAAVSSRP